MNKKSIGILAAVVVIVCAAVFGGIYATRNIGKSEKKITQESAVNRLEKMVKKIEPRTALRRTRRQSCRTSTPARWGWRR